VPEVRRVILAIAAPEEERVFRLGWSLWRRAHQAIARRCHMARCTVREVASEKKKKKVEPSAVPVSTTTIILDRERAKLAEEQWARLKPLLPEKGHRGGQWREHRTVVEAILWVLVNGASWRDLPEEFGPWQTAYQRYVRWQHEGLWQCIVEILQC
jgi:Putative transposase of IS4/5 family (DUF4096)